MTWNVWISNLTADLQYALRMIRKTPGASGIAVLSLALGIGANTSIFSLVDTVLLKLLPVKAPQELFVCVTGRPERPSPAWSYPDYVAFRDQNRSLAGLAAAGLSTMSLGMQSAEGEATSDSELTYSLFVSGNYFEVLGVDATLGRLFNSEEDRAPGASPYVVLSYDYWRSRFQGDMQVIGRKLRLNGYPFTTVGVARRGFRSTDVSVGPNMYLPMIMRDEVTGGTYSGWKTRRMIWLQLIGRIKPNVSAKQAEADLYTIIRSQEEGERGMAADPRFVHTASAIHLLPAVRGYSQVRNRLEKPLLVLMAIVGLVLLVACANVANLMLARGAARQREIAVRLALGASRSRLTGQLFTESVTLAFLGGAAGLALSYFGVQVLMRFLPQTGYSQTTLNVAPDGRLLAFTTAVSLLTSILFGLAPALQSTRPALITALHQDTPGSGASRFGLRSALVVVQVALSLLLVIGAGLFVRSLDQLRNIEAGFRTEHTLIAMVDPSRNGYQGQRMRDFYERLLAGVERLPGVRSASLVRITPLGGMRMNAFVTAEGYRYKAGNVKEIDRAKLVDMNAVGPRFFETVGTPLVSGREFRDEDSPAVLPDPPAGPRMGPAPELPGPRFAIVNESFAKKYFAGRNAVGMHLSWSENYDPAKAYEIVGVVKDAHYFGLREATEPMVYTPIWRQGAAASSLCVRTGGQSGGLGAAIRHQVAAIDPAVPLLSTRTIEQEIDNNILVDRLLTTLSGFFGSLALLLAAVGLYGVISYAVTQRTREIGIRMALGAERSSVIWLVARYAAALVLAGAAIGVPAALALTRLVKAFLFGITAQDPFTIMAATLTLLLAAALASFAPTWRATLVDPMVALRHE